MSMQAHINSLYNRHKQLEDEIRDAHTHHRPTTELKKKKLLIKEEIELLRGHSVALQKAA